jgi:plasmid stabilization system protein ParE
MLFQSSGKAGVMKRYKVFISDRALADMESIYDHIADILLEPMIATKQYNRIAEAILTLEQMPERIKLMDSEPERSEGLRSLLVDNYTVFFMIKVDTVHVARVLYSASDIRKKLLEE